MCNAADEIYDDLVIYVLLNALSVASIYWN